MDLQPATVPKFSSFQRKVAPPTDDTRSSPPLKTSATQLSQYELKEHREHSSKGSRAEIKRHRTRDQSRDRHQARHERPRGSHERRRRIDHRTHEDVREAHALAVKPSQPDTVGVTPGFDESNQPYYIDRRGDPHNATYGGLNTHSVPPYYRAGGGSIVGLCKTRRIQENLSSGRGITLSYECSHASLNRKLLSKQYAKQSSDIKHRITRATSLRTGIDHNADYISTSFGRKRKRWSTSPMDTRRLTNASHIAWRSASSDEELSGSDPEDCTSDFLYADGVKERNAELSRLTKEKPKSLDGWLQLIEHQDKMIRLHHGAISRRLTKAEIRNVAEIRISVYEQALRSIDTDHTNRVSLCLGLLEEGSKVWEATKITKQWRQLLEEFPDHIEVWLKYLNFLQTDFREFRLDTVREDYHNCLQMLSDLREKTPQPGVSTCKLQRIQLYILARLTKMISESGYHEQALAIWQVIIENNFLRPAGVEDPIQSLILFEEFWDSEVARVGELGATGWCNFREVSVLPKTDRQDLAADEVSKSPLSAFYQLETSHMQTIDVPGRTSDKAAEEDPYHVVLFSDISVYLSLVGHGLPMTRVVEAFLAFWDLPPLPGPNETPFDSRDVFLRKGTIHKKVDSPKDGGPLGHFVETMGTVSSLPIRRRQTTIYDLFSDAFHTFANTRSKIFVKTVLQHLSSLTKDEAILEYSMAFTVKFFPQEADAFARRILQRCPSSLRLYNAYALVECRMGNKETASRVFGTAIRMSAKLPVGARKDVILLRHSSIWESLHQGDLIAVQSELLAIASPNISESNQDINIASFLPARTSLINARDEHYAVHDYDRAVLYTDCLAVLIYLYSDQDLSLAIDVYRTAHDHFSTLNLAISRFNEINHQACTRLLAYHASRWRSFKPSLLRDTLTASLKLFPDNTDLLSLFAANESRFRIDGRVRTLMDDISLHSDNGSIIMHMFAISTEIQRGVQGGSTAYSVRAAFERAVLQPHVQSNASLWTSYVMFETLEAGKSHTKDARDRVKGVFFRGMFCIPWCKSYMMLAFAPELKGLIGVEDLRKVWRVMGEKQIRVFVDLDDIFAKVGEEGRIDIHGVLDE
ncbi:DUF1740-domain-containing protein [Pseudovirgaria hyperparasitica]|uniref:DUF1740-domain-containing protein n=1 Tax=Pseudovirgaria hyperparasitica TaxID=470096 RepID=A0A6A6W1K1_9PEZI|nr:DUF1740-domain-containing protein [Pseudovirgaria hyperparasitica]KAF2756798.1 DUF1740-domain-containing protein [Pseudovirgaria hyperparasitica]